MDRTTQPSKQIPRLMFLFAIAGLVAITADFACLEDVCAPAEKTYAAFKTLDDVAPFRIESLSEGLARSGVELDPTQRLTLKERGQLFGVVKLDRPVKHPNGTVELPRDWLPEIPEGHPWQLKLTPSDDAFYSYVETRIITSRLYDPENPEHVAAIDAYLTRANSSNPTFVGWTYVGGRTECSKRKADAAGTGVKMDAEQEPDA